MRPFFRVQIQTHAARRNTKISRPHGRDFEQARKLETKSVTHNPSHPMKSNHHNHASRCATSHARNTSSIRFLTRLLPAFTVSLFVLLFTAAPKAEAGLLDTIKKARDARETAKDAQQEAAAVAKDTGIVTSDTTAKLTTVTTGTVVTSGTTATTAGNASALAGDTVDALAKRIKDALEMSTNGIGTYQDNMRAKYEIAINRQKKLQGSNYSPADAHIIAMQSAERYVIDAMRKDGWDVQILYDKNVFLDGGVQATTTDNPDKGAVRSRKGSGK